MSHQTPFTGIGFGLLILLAATAASGAVVFDGTLNFSPGQEWGTADNSAVQDNHTGYGDQITNGFTGSELDELFVRTDGTYLYIGVTGNLEQSGNAIVILLDTDLTAGVGQNRLKTEITPESTYPTTHNCLEASIGPPFAVPNLGQGLLNSDAGTPETTDDTTIRDLAVPGTLLDSGFEPDHAIALDTFGGNMHVTQYSLSATPLAGTWDDPATNNGPGNCVDRIEALEYFAVRKYLGEAPVDTGVLATPSGSQYAFNNTDYHGVSGASVTGANAPSTQTKGLEAKISLADLGITTPVTGDLIVKVSVLLTSGGGLVSNQVLPGLGQGVSITNLNFRPDFTLQTGGAVVNAGGVVVNAGDQYATVTRSQTAFSGTIDGDIATDAGFWGAAVASQDTTTGFGDHPQNPNQNSGGSEIDQLFIQDGLSPDTLGPAMEIGITGNLEGNGNNLVIWLDTKTGGEGESGPLDANAGRITGMAGDRIPLDADYALILNVSGGTLYADLIDLQAAVGSGASFLGSDQVADGNGILSNGGTDNVIDWRVRLNNSNTVGVNGNNAQGGMLQEGNALTATTGFEISIPVSAIGSPAEGRLIRVFAMIGNNNMGYLSNQFLPAGLGGLVSNFDNGNDDLTSYHSLTMMLGSACNTPRFDDDDDGDVDMDDFGVLQECFTGTAPGNVANPAYDVAECSCLDYGGGSPGGPDGKIDLVDFASFVACASGASVPADEHCAGQ